MNIESPASFWRCHPAAYYGLHVYVGSALALGQSTWTLVLLIPLWLGQCSLRQIWVPVLVAIISWSYVTVLYRFPDCPEEGVVGSALVAIDDVSVNRGHFGSSWFIRGRILSMLSKQERIGRRIPVSMTLPLSATAPIPGRSYWVDGRLHCSPEGRYRLKVLRKEEWKESQSFSPLSIGRGRVKKAMRQSLERRLGQGQTTAFLVALVTGELGDGQLLLTLGRFGLQHLIAISGFHFSILAAVMAGVMRRWLPPGRAAGCVGFFLSVYFLLMGLTPSVLRAWVMAIVALLGVMLARPARAVNSLGVALIVVAIVDPPTLMTLGFQFSFGCTAALVLLVRPCENMVGYYWALRPVPTSDSSLFSKLTYLMSRGIRNALIVSLAVNLIAIPLTLAYYHRFPLSGIVLNLIFPFLVGVVMILIGIGGMVLILLPCLGNWLLQIAWKVADIALSVPTQMPAYFDFYLRSPGVPSWVLACGASLLLIIGTSRIGSCTVCNRRLYPWGHGKRCS